MRTCVAKFTSAFAANVAKGMLESNGIPAMVTNENMTFITGVANTDMLAIELLVNEEDYLEAKRLLAASSSEL
jgi:hypothetical protein